MANTTFSGPIRSENGFIGITKNSSTGAITENITFGNKGEVVTPVVLADGDITIVNTTHGGRINLVPDNTNFYKGNIVHLDTNADNAAVYPNGSSNSSLQLNVPAAFDVTFIGLDSTNYQVFGNVTSTTAPAFADQ
jgi:hypothetical protein